MRSLFALPVLLRLATAREREFSVHNDLLAFPQYEIALSESFVPETEAEQLLAAAKTHRPVGMQWSQQDRQELQKPLKSHIHDSQTSHGSSDTSSESTSKPPTEYFERLILRGRPHLCSIPYIEPPSSKNNSIPTDGAEAAAQAAEEKKQKQRELIRATNHGWELLKEMQGHCMYYNAGWWVYSFCYNKPDGIKQFHPLPPGRHGVPIYPPVEDEGVKSYILGQFDHEIEAGTGNSLEGSDQPDDGLLDLDGNENNPQLSDGKDTLLKEDTSKDTTNALYGKSKQKKKNPLTQLATQNSQTYLVRHLSGGTECDLTGLPRKVSVQFHCNPNTVNHISMIKETASCVYLMIIQTPLLCNDVAFHPPTDDVPNTISCREIVDDSQPGTIKAWKDRKEHQAKNLFKGAFPFGQRAAENVGPGGGFGGGDQGIGADELEAAGKSGDHVVIGGVSLGAQKLVGGSEDRTIKASNILAKLESGGSADRKFKVLATLAESNGKQTSVMTEREMKNSGLIEKGVSREEVEKWVKKIENGPGAKGIPWRINIVRTDEGLELRVVLDPTESEAGDDSTESDDGSAKQKGKAEAGDGKKTRKDANTGGDAGSQEEYK